MGGRGPRHDVARRCQAWPAVSRAPGRDSPLTRGLPIWRRRHPVARVAVAAAAAAAPWCRLRGRARHALRGRCGPQASAVANVPAAGIAAVVRAARVIAVAMGLRGSLRPPGAVGKGGSPRRHDRLLPPAELRQRSLRCQQPGCQAPVGLPRAPQSLFDANLHKVHGSVRWAALGPCGASTSQAAPDLRRGLRARPCVPVARPMRML